MEDKKVKQLLEELEAYRQELAGNASASKQFLINAGIINAGGDLQDNYKNLCIPQEQV